MFYFIFFYLLAVPPLSSSTDTVKFSWYACEHTTITELVFLNIASIMLFIHSIFIIVTAVFAVTDDSNCLLGKMDVGLVRHTTLRLGSVVHTLASKLYCLLKFQLKPISIEYPNKIYRIGVCEQASC